MSLLKLSVMILLILIILVVWFGVTWIVVNMLRGERNELVRAGRDDTAYAGCLVWGNMAGG